MQNASSTTSAPQIWVAPEDTAEFEQTQSALTLEFAPSTEFQRQCLITILHCLWTIRRTRIAECKMQERAYNKGLIDPMLDPDWAKQLKGILEMRRQAERSRIQAVKDFHSAPRPRPDLDKAESLPSAETAAATATDSAASSNPKVIGMPNRAARPSVSTTTTALPVDHSLKLAS